MAGYQNYELIGYLVRDCEVSKTRTTGQSVCNFSVAVNEPTKTQSGEWSEITTYVDCTAWRKQADFLGVYGKKGLLVHVVGKWRKNSYTDRDGIKRIAWTVEATTVTKLEKNERQQEEPHADLNPQEFISEEELPW